MLCIIALNDRIFVRFEILLLLKKGLSDWNAAFVLSRTALACLRHESLRSKITPRYLAESLQGMRWLLTISLGGCSSRFEKETASDLVSLRLKPHLWYQSSRVGMNLFITEEQKEICFAV